MTLELRSRQHIRVKTVGKPIGCFGNIGENSAEWLIVSSDSFILRDPMEFNSQVKGAFYGAKHSRLDIVCVKELMDNK